MARIRGYYEWDDDSLTPGRKKEGGLHQNLFDADGSLKGSARFVPSEGDDSDPEYVTEFATEHIYVPTEERRLTAAQQELADLVSEVAIVFLAKSIERAKPHVKKWWTQSARPFVSKHRLQLVNALPKRASKRDKDHGALTPERDAGKSVAQNVVAVALPKMSSAEAQARYLAAMAARAFSEEQMNMVQNAHIIDAEGLAEIGVRTAKLPSGDVRELITRMVADPSLLGEPTLADLASALARVNHRGDGEFRYLTRDSNQTTPVSKHPGL